MPDSIKFSELPSGTLSANSIFATAEEAGGGSFASTKVNAANIGNYLVGALQYAGINTEDKTVEGALNELLTYASNIAEEYDSTATYDEGDFVIYEGVLYKCTTAISTPEAWTPAHWTSTLVVDNFGSGGASVTLGTSAPSDSSGENGDLYVQYEALTYKVVEYFVKINNSWRKSPYSRVVALTQAEYDLITPDPSTLYIITDAQSSYQKKQDSNLQTTSDTIVGAINELNTAKADASDITANALRSTLILDNFAVYSAERILANATKDIPLTQNLFVLFIKSYADARTFGVYLISYHGSVASGQYISTVAQGSYLMPTLSIVDVNKLRIATGAIDVYYSMLRLN